MAEDFSYCYVSGNTDVGCVRKANEDSWATFVSPNGLVAVVCDGMGGHVGGAEASRTAIGAIQSTLMQGEFGTVQEAIAAAIAAAKNGILARAEEHPELHGMGSTCVITIVKGGLVYYGHVGDSRIYLVRDRQITQLTRDHSYVQSLVDAGEITPEEAEHHPRKNQITNALGFEEMGTPTIAEPLVPKSGDCILLCSDGLSGMVSNGEICQIVADQQRMRAQERADLLIERARFYGGTDNITAAIVEFTMDPGQLGTAPGAMPPPVPGVAGEPTTQPNNLASAAPAAPQGGAPVPPPAGAPVPPPAGAPVPPLPAAPKKANKLPIIIAAIVGALILGAVAWFLWGNNGDTTDEPTTLEAATFQKGQRLIEFDFNEGKVSYNFHPNATDSVQGTLDATFDDLPDVAVEGNDGSMIIDGLCVTFADTCKLSEARITLTDKAKHSASVVIPIKNGNDSTSVAPGEMSKPEPKVTEIKLSEPIIFGKGVPLMKLTLFAPKGNSWERELSVAYNFRGSNENTDSKANVTMLDDYTVSSDDLKIVKKSDGEIDVAADATFEGNKVVTVKVRDANGSGADIKITVKSSVAKDPKPEKAPEKEPSIKKA